MRTLLPLLLLFVLFGGCGSEPAAPVTSYVVDVRVVQTHSNLDDRLELTGFTTWRRANGDRKTLLNYWNRPPGDAGFSVRNGVLTGLRVDTQEYFAAVALDGYGSSFLRIGPIDAPTVEAFLEQERLIHESHGGLFTIHPLDDGVILDRPVVRAEVRSQYRRIRYAIDAEAGFVLGYSLEFTPGGSVFYEATRVEYHAVVTDSDLALDVTGRIRIEPPSPVFTPIPEP